MSCLRLLFLTPQLPYPPHQGPTKGTTIRNHGLLAGLAVRHEIHLETFLAPGDDPADLWLLQDVCEAVHAVLQPERTRWKRLWTTLTSRQPDMAHRLASLAFEQTLVELLAEHSFDVIQLEGIEMAPYLPVLLEHVRTADPPPRLIFDEHNAEYVLQKRVFETDVRAPARWPGALYSFLQWQKLKRFEAWACRQVDAVAAVSDVDALALQRIVPNVNVTVVPNGIDVQAYTSYVVPSPMVPPHTLVFTGTMNYRPNVDAVLWFANHVYPLILEAVPDVHFYIVGREPHPRLERLRERHGIVITGSVSDTRPYIAGADKFVKERKRTIKNIEYLYTVEGLENEVRLNDVLVIWKHKRNAVVKQTRKGRGVFIYGAAGDLEVGKRYDLLVRAIKTYKGLKELTHVYVLNEKAEEDVSSYLLDHSDLSKKVSYRQNEIFSELVGIYKNKKFHIEGREIPIYFKNKKFTPPNGTKLKIHNAHLGYYKKLQLVVYRKKDFVSMEI